MRTLALATSVSLVALLAACSSKGTLLPTGGPDIVDPDIVDPGHPSMNAPVFGSLAVASRRTVAISGGTLASRATIAVASDPDRDAVSIIDLMTQQSTTLALHPGDEPGRVVIDDHAVAHVVLREGGAIVSIDTKSKAIIARRDVCKSPRGIAHDATTDKLTVACAEGVLVHLSAAILAGDGSAVLDRVQIPRDARDVIVHDGQTFVSTFRAADVYAIDALGVSTRVQHASDTSVAWRLLPPLKGATGEFTLLAQNATGQVVRPTHGGYGSGGGQPCGGSIVTTALIAAGTTPVSVPAAVLAVDAVAFSGGYALVSAGNTYNIGLPQLVIVMPGDSPCGGQNGIQIPGQATAVTTAADGSLLVQTREPAALLRVTTNGGDVTPIVVLATDSLKDTGHQIFHANSGAGLACASCHPEGGDDGRTWKFATDFNGKITASQPAKSDPSNGPSTGFDNGGSSSNGSSGSGSVAPTPNGGSDNATTGSFAERRTPSLRGTVKGTAPYHWDGDMKDMSTLMTEVFVGRMSGPRLVKDQVDLLQGWLEAVPAPKAYGDPASASATRGKAIFEDKKCASCHASATASFNVGTGSTFQAPPLAGVGLRAPYMHDGCATTLDARFQNPTCGGNAHGDVANISASDRADLIQYLDAL